MKEDIGITTNDIFRLVLLMTILGAGIIFIFFFPDFSNPDYWTR